MIADGLDSENVSRFSAVLSQEELRAALGKLSMSEWHWGKPEEIRVQPLKAHKGRGTFNIALKTASGWHDVISKVHTIDRSDVFLAMEGFSKSGFGPNAEFAIPRPLAYMSSFNVLLEEKVQGTRAMEVFLKGSQDQQTIAAQRCGHWLARFHTEAPRVSNVSEQLEQLPLLDYWARHLKNFGKQLADLSEPLVRKLEAMVQVAGEFEHCEGHGSYMPEHVFLNGQRTITIDFDEHCVADPARDAAWFIVSLQRLGLKNLGSLHAHDRPVKAFLRTYSAAGRPNLLEHLQFYRAMECLHRGSRDLYKRIPPSPQWARIMVDEGLRMLRDPS